MEQLGVVAMVMQPCDMMLPFEITSWNNHIHVIHACLMFGMALEGVHGHVGLRLAMGIH